MRSCDVRQDRHQAHCFFAFRKFYKDNFMVETSVKMNYCAIFRCTTNTGHYREYTFILRFLVEKLTLNVSRNLSFEIARLRIVFVSIAAALTCPHTGHIHYKQTHKQTNKQTNKQTHKHTNKQTDKQTNKQINKQTNSQTNKQTNK